MNEQRRPLEQEVISSNEKTLAALKKRHQDKDDETKPAQEVKNTRKVVYPVEGVEIPSGVTRLVGGSAGYSLAMMFCAAFPPLWPIAILAGLVGVFIGGKVEDSISIEEEIKEEPPKKKR